MIPLYLFFECKKKKNFYQSSFDENTMKNIEQIISQITSPTYKKTPYFERKYPKHTRYIKKVKVVTLQDIRSILNKISYQNYDKLSKQLLEMIESSEEKTEFLKEIFDLFFEIISKNKCMGDIYVDIHNDIYNYSFTSNQKISELYILCLNNFITQYQQSFLEIIIVTPNQDYDLFCKESKNNEIRNNQSIFLGKSSIYINYFIDILFDSYFEYLQIDDKEKLNQIVDNIYLFISSQIHSIDKIEENKKEKWKKETFHLIIKCIEKLKENIEKNLFSNRAKFKCLDLFDLWKKHQKDNHLIT